MHYDELPTHWRALPGQRQFRTDAHHGRLWYCPAADRLVHASAAAITAEAGEWVPVTHPEPVR